MIKKIILLFCLTIFGYFLSLDYTMAVNAPTINCFGLPGCTDTEIEEPKAPVIDKDLGTRVIVKLIGQFIQYVAVVAVIALMLSGIMYLVSGGEEEKVKKAKNWIIWSLIGVFLSITAWGIINMINNIIIS